MDVELRPRRCAAGFSLIEVLVASVLFITIALGILPLMTQSMRNNRSGAESTELANMARSRLEEFFQMPFDSTDLTLDTGIEKPHLDYYSEANREWVDGTPPPEDPARWLRTTRIRQYGIAALDDGDLDPATEALPAGTPASQVHIKEIVVQLQGVRTNSLFGPPKRLTLRTIKSQ